LFTILFVFIASVGGVFWYYKSNKWSKEKLMFEILGPEVMQSGDEVDYLVRLKNNDKFSLEEVELVFEYPSQAIPVNYEEQRVVQEIDDIYPGEERTISFRARVFGRENDVLEAKTLITYKPKNLKARYDRESSFVGQISFVPMTFEFDLPLKVEQTEQMEISLNYFSNIDYLLESLRLRVFYPEGFTFSSSKPRAIDETEWDLPSLSQANGGRVEIKGSLEGSEGSRKVFKAQLGILLKDQFVVLKEAQESVEIIEPSLYISQLINSSQNYIAQTDDLLHYEIFFKNIGRKPIQKKFLFVRLEGEFFDLSSLRSINGGIGKGDNSIIWDWKNVPSLRFLDVEEEGKVEF